MKLSLIIPSYHDGDNVIKLIDQIAKNDSSSAVNEIIVVESGDDSYFKKIQNAKVSSYLAKKGRANQLNYGVSKSSGDVFLFIHADSNVQNMDFSLIKTIKHKKFWGNYKLKFNHDGLYYRFMEWTSNLRAGVLHLPFGDQAMFISKPLIKKIKGFDPDAGFEDLDASRKLKKVSNNIVLNSQIITSARRFEKHGKIKTHFIMFLIATTYLMRMRALAFKLYNFIK